MERQATTSRASAKAPDDGAQPASTEGVAESAASGREERNQQPAAVAVAATSSIRSAADAAAAEDGGAVSAAAAELQQQGAEPTAKLLPKRGVKQVRKVKPQVVSVPCLGCRSWAQFFACFACYTVLKAVLTRRTN